MRGGATRIGSGEGGWCARTEGVKGFGACVLGRRGDANGFVDAVVGKSERVPGQRRADLRKRETLRASLIGRQLFLLRGVRAGVGDMGNRVHRRQLLR
jgi:hypothetical protein